MRISTHYFHQRGIDNISNQQSRLSELQYQISTGKRINRPSDDPVDAARIVALKQEIDGIAQYIRAGDTARTRLELAENTLSGVSDSIEKIRQLAIQANGGALSTNDFFAITTELQSRLSQLVDFANTRSVNGEYIFSGYQSARKTVSIDSAGTYQYGGDDGFRAAKIGAFTEVAVSDSGHDVFFDISAEHSVVTGFTGSASVTTTTGGLATSGTLSTLNANELRLNGYTISAASADNVSTTDSSASAIAIAAAINGNQADHKVTAEAQATSLNLGVPTFGDLAGTDFTLNGQNITGTITNMADLTTAINLHSTTTGVVASDNGGSLVLTAADGRNIQVQTDGATAGATFANFDLTSGALDQVQRGAVRLYDQNSFEISGLNPGDIGLSLGTVAVSANSGNAVLSTPEIVSTPPSSDAQYIVRFSNSTTYSIYKASDPSTPMTNYENLDYTAGEKVTVEGIEFSISGTPSANDNFILDLKSVQKQDLFTTVDQLIKSIQQHGGDSARLNYEIGNALENLEQAETQIVTTRAKLGSRMNIVDAQQDVNTQFDIIAQTALSAIQDVDIAQAISELQLTTVALQAAQQSYVRIQGLSLFNYLR